MVVPKHSDRYHIDKQQSDYNLSMISRSTHRKTKKIPRISQVSCFENEKSFSNATEDAGHKYEALERILKHENANLKGQNDLLLHEVQRLKATARKYKEKYQQQQLELEEAREECEAQKRRADEMKEIVMGRLAALEGQMVEGGHQGNFSSSDCESLLEALTLSESGIK